MKPSTPPAVIGVDVAVDRPEVLLASVRIAVSILVVSLDIIVTVLLLNGADVVMVVRNASDPEDVEVRVGGVMMEVERLVENRGGGLMIRDCIWGQCNKRRVKNL